MNAGEYPSSWCEGVVNPIYKQNSRLDPENYRKITITCALGKLFEIILNNRLTHAKKILQKEDPHQFGFKEKSRAIDCAFILNGVIDICAGRKRPLYACFVDFRSAFDKVNRHALMYKMLEQGIRGNFFNVVKSMFDKAKSRVKWGNALGEIFRNMHGVLQGGVISPTLFKIFLEDLCLYLDPENGIMVHNVRVSYLLFADDLMLFSESKSGVQKLLYGLQNFCQRWQMTVNLNKTKLCIFNDKYCINDNSGPILFNNKPIEICKEYHYLGITFSTSKNRFKTHFTKKRDKALNAIFAARKTVREAVGSQQSLHLQLKIFDTQIQPIFNYGSEIWYTGKQVDEFETLHLCYIKRSLGVKISTSTLAVFGETGRFPLILQHKESILKYWFRLLSLPEDTLLRNVYVELMHTESCGQRSWCQIVRDTLNEYQMANLWGDQRELDDDVIQNSISNIRIFAQNQYKHKWTEQIQDENSNPVLRTYRLFKNNHCMESYLSQVKNNKYRICLTKFRVSSHRLRIEVGRHQRPKLPLEQRICTFCNANEIDDEVHLVKNCQFHNEERRILLNKIQRHFNSINHEDMLTPLVQSDCFEVQNAFGKFLYSCFYNRQQTRA